MASRGLGWLLLEPLAGFSWPRTCGQWLSLLNTSDYSFGYIAA